MRKTVLPIACLIGIALAIALNQSESREYCRFRFGTEKPLEFLFARSGESLLIYRDADSSRAPDVYGFADGSLDDGVTIPIFVDPAGTEYLITSISEYFDEGPPRRHSLMAHVTIRVDSESAFRQYCDVALSPSPQDAGYCHFNGPLEVGPVTAYRHAASEIRLVRGDEPNDVYALVGTFDRRGGCWTVLEAEDGAFPPGVFPTVTVVYEADVSSPESLSFDLDQFC